jgi:hypothetical protein
MDIDLKTVLTEAGFHVQDTSYDQIITSKSLRDKIDAEFGATPLASIFHNYPTYFLMHEKLEPEQGYLFCAVVTDKLSSEAMKVYKTYFPPELFVIHVCGASKTLLAAWASTPTKKTPLTSFLSSELGIKNLDPLRAKLKSQGWTS